ncbi:DUF2059 domain-containing protein [Halioxenophilus aromaticivorans]|uniref:DUF2059 domain-containing protein n=1 Tax=Halioxenophilus aromaticivorans TaxID=1306992 RepID=A0AAV3U3Z5_9ALTE
MRAWIVGGFWLLVASGVSAEGDRSEVIDVIIEGAGYEQYLEKSYSRLSDDLKKMPGQLKMSESEMPIFDRYYAQIMQLVKEEWSWANVRDNIYALYDDSFTDAELEIIATMYEADAINTITKKMPQVTNRANEIAQDNVKSILPEIKALTKSMAEKVKSMRAAK